MRERSANRESGCDRPGACAVSGPPEPAALSQPGRTCAGGRRGAAAAPRGKGPAGYGWGGWRCAPAAVGCGRLRTLGGSRGAERVARRRVSAGRTRGGRAGRGGAAGPGGAPASPAVRRAPGRASALRLLRRARGFGAASRVLRPRLAAASRALLVHNGAAFSWRAPGAHQPCPDSRGGRSLSACGPLLSLGDHGPLQSVFLNSSRSSAPSSSPANVILFRAS